MKLNINKTLKYNIMSKNQQQTMVRKIPNSGFMSTQSPSEKMNCLRRSLRALSTIAICWAATDNTGKSIRLNSSKQPQDPLWAKPACERGVV